MRTNIEIDDDIMQAAMSGHAFKTKREAVEAGLKLLAQQARYREILKWKGKLHWDDQPAPQQTVAVSAKHAVKKPAKLAEPSSKIHATRRKAKAVA